MAVERPNPLAAVLYRPEAEKLNPELLEIFEGTMWPFLANIMTNLPTGNSQYEKLYESLRVFFGVDYRNIYTYIAEEDFHIAALFLYPKQSIWNPEAKEALRLVRRREIVIARTDTRTPWEMEVQVLSHVLKDLDDRRQFSMGYEEYHNMRRRLRLVGNQ